MDDYYRQVASELAAQLIEEKAQRIMWKRLSDSLRAELDELRDDVEED